MVIITSWGSIVKCGVSGKIYIAIYHQNFKCNQSGKIEERRQITNFLPVYKIIHTYNYVLNTLTDNVKLSKKPFV